MTVQISVDKFHRIYHLPNSPGLTRDDKKIQDLTMLVAMGPVMFMEKLDGSNICIGKDYLHARSHNGPPTHPSFDYLKQIAPGIQSQIPTGWSLYFEYCYAVHALVYPEMKNCLHLIGIKDEISNTYMDWKTVSWVAAALELTTVPVLLVDGTPNIKSIQDTATKLAGLRSLYGPQKEGIVVRTTEAYKTGVSDRVIAKYVRAGHVLTNEHWMGKMIIKQPGLEL